MSATPRILVVDDDRAVRTVLNVNLSKRGMEVTLCATANEALELLHERPYDVILTDVKMPGDNGLDLLQHVKSAWPSSQVVVMTGYGSVQDAVTAMKGGATDYIIKPITKDELMVIIDRALEERALRAELVQLRQEVQRQYGFENLIGTTPVMLSLYEDVEAVADTNATILLQGATGTGKELLAHALHYRSRRASGPFVQINCAAIPKSLLESELFGHEKGSFTGAIRQHRGKFEQADGGTLLLDEIGEIDPMMQVRLLRVLQNGEFHRVGGSQTIGVDVRVLAATNKDLRAEVEAGRFREDLYYRLNVVTIRVPLLCERRDDIPLLLDHFVQRYAKVNHRPVPKVSTTNMNVLMAYSWPGNVRQLEHTVERSVILHKEGEPFEILLPDTPAPRAQPSLIPDLPDADVSLQQAIEHYERRILTAALREAGGVQARAARRLSLSRSNLNYRLKRLGIRVRDLTFE